jgi:PAS domain S-box-containing protein
MSKKPTYKELELRVNELDRKAARREQVEEALRKSEERYRSFIDNLGDVAYTTDTQGNVTYANKMAETITGESLEDIVGKPFLPLFTQGSQKIAIDVYQRTLNGERPEYELTFTSGRTGYFKNEPLTDKNGKIIGVFGIARDMTDRKQAEEALRESEIYYRDLAESLNELVYRADGKTFEPTYVNSAVVGLYGYTVEEWLKEPTLWENTIHPDDKERVLQELGDAKTNMQNRDCEYRIIRKDRTVRWVEDHVSFQRDQQGRVVSLNGVMYDITERNQAQAAMREAHDQLERRVEERTAELARTNEVLRKQIADRKEAEDKLRDSEQMARALLNTPTDVAAVLDRRGIVLDANQTMRRRFQKSVDDLRGVCVWDLLSPNVAKLRKSYVDKVFQSGKPVRIVDKRDGHWFDNVVHPVFDAKGKVSKVAILARDITEMKRKEKELEEKEAELKTKAQNLKELNTALRVLLKQREGDKTELEEKVLSNVKDLVLPYVEKLKKTSLDSNQKSCVDILESNLKEIVSPFSRKLSSKYLALTPTEIRVANLVKEGKSTKEIAEFMNLSTKGVDFHRVNIRKKLGIKNKSANLRTHLLSM